MGQLHDQEAWAQGLRSKEVVAALDAWVARKPFHLRHRGWFTDGRSGGPVALTLRDYGDDSDQLVLKFFDDANAKRAANIQQAWLDVEYDDEFRRHLAEVRDETIMLGNWCAVFLHVADGNLASAKPLTSFFNNPDFPDHCTKIIGSVLREWNKNRTPREPSSVAAVLNEIMDRRRTGALGWARESGVPVDDPPTRIHRKDWPEPLQNPFTFVTGATAVEPVEDLLVGKAHGDLSGRNILIPTDPFEADSYLLIDCDRYSDRAPLARDPMHLLVALALDWLDRYGRDAWWEIARLLVNPKTPNPPSDLNHIRQISTAIREASAPDSRKGLGAEWDQQCLLSLVGVGLVHLGRRLYTKQPEEAKEWCLFLAALAAESYLLARPKHTRVAITTVPIQSPVGGRDGTGSLVDRTGEVHGLWSRLTSGPGGVVVIRGTRGIGKTKLVDAVLNDMSRQTAGLAQRIHRHEVKAAALDVRTLVDSVVGEAEPARQQDSSSLVRLEVALQQLGKSRVVVSVDSAENLLDPDTGKLIDRDLDEALEMLVSEHEHRVTVLLVTQHELTSPDDRTWPMAEAPIYVGKLPFPEFRAYLAGLDRHGRTDPANLPEKARRALYDKLQGNPRLAELVYAIVAVTASGLDLHALTQRLVSQNTGRVPAFLTRLLADSVSPLQHRVLKSLAAFGIPVPATAVAGLLKDDPSELVDQALVNLAANRIIYRVGEDRYLVPPDDGDLILSSVTDHRDRSLLYFRAATQLTKLQNRHPRQVSDFQVHFAELAALLRADEPGAAYDMIELIDDMLSKWNCSHLLLEYRKKVRGHLGDEHLEMANENALGGIYVSYGTLPSANEAYGNALRIATARQDHVSRMRVYANLAAMYWEQNDTHNALGYFELARDEAGRLHDPMVTMGTLEGIADCHRRHGDYDRAIDHRRRTGHRHAGCRQDPA